MDPEEADELTELSALLDREGQERAPPAPCDKTLDSKPNNIKTFQDIDIFGEESSDTSFEKLPSLSEAFINKDTKSIKHGKSEIHCGDTDSSDEEENKNSTNQKFTESGRAIKNLLKNQDITKPSTTKYSDHPTSSWKTNKSLFAPSVAPSTSVLEPPKDVYTDPYFGLRIINPLISSKALIDKMQGRMVVCFNKLPNHLSTLDKTKDWVIAGVIVSKFIGSSQTGAPYLCWTISDLKIDLHTVSVYMFGKTCQKLLKTNTHTVVAILNPTPLEKRKSSKDIATLAVRNPDTVMILGQSKDLGTCKMRKKNGEPCKSFVNKNQSDACNYHVVLEYRKVEKKAAGLSQLQNKILGRNEVFYAGKSYSATVAKPTKNQAAKDKQRLGLLFNNSESRFGPEIGSAVVKSKSAANSARVQLMKDAERHQKRTGSPATVTSLTLALGVQTENKKPISKIITKDVLEKEKSETDKRATSLFEARKNTNQNEKRNDCSISKRIDGYKKTSDQQLSNSEKPKSNTTKQPTKNRFENLTKLKSVHFKAEESTQSGPHYPHTASKFQTPIAKTIFQPNAIFQMDDSKDERCVTKSLQNVQKGTECKSTPASNKSSLISSNKRNSPTNLESLTDTYRERPLKLNPERSLKLNPELLLEQKTMDYRLRNVEKVVNDFTSGNLRDLVHNNTPALNEFGIMNFNIPSPRVTAAKAKALKYVACKGPIHKEDPKEKNKRKRNHIEGENPKSEKSSLSKQFIELMNMTSKHSDLISSAENQALDEYFDILEKKEKLENKMMSTFKVDCKAVRCLKCNYKWFSASEKCKAEHHPIKVISAIKRFFQCQNCKNRTVTLEIIPLHNCTNCGNGNWIRAPMMREQKSSNVHLSIRGGEQKFMNSVVTDTNLDLHVPDDE